MANTQIAEEIKVSPGFLDRAYGYYSRELERALLSDFYGPPSNYYPLREPILTQSRVIFPLMTNTIASQENTNMARPCDEYSTDPVIDKGILSRDLRVATTVNGGFTIGGYTGTYAFTNADDLLAFLKGEVKKFNDGTEAEAAAKKAAGKR